MITVNGVKRTLEQPLSVTEYLEKNQYIPVQVAIELNDQILARELYGSTILKEGDVMEIVSFMGGGSGKNEEMDRTEDKLILGGHEFTSRFILGSGKFSLDLVKACIEKGRNTDHYACPSSCKSGGHLRIFWIIFQRTLRFFQIPPEREMRRRLCVSRDFPESLDVVILSRLKLSMIPNIFFRTTMETIKATEILAKRRVCSYAVYVSGFECSKRPG